MEKKLRRAAAAGAAAAMVTGLVAGLVAEEVRSGRPESHASETRAVRAGAPETQPVRSNLLARDKVVVRRKKDTGPHGEVTLAFAGDVHFQLHLAGLLDRPRGALGPIARTLPAADLTMVNLESRDHRARHAGGQGAGGPGEPLLVPHLAGRARRPRRGRRRRGHDGQQPRRRLRAVGLADTLRARRTARSPWSASARTGGRVHAVPRHGPRHRHRLPRRRRIPARRDAARRLGRRVRRRPGIAAAHAAAAARPPRRGASREPSSPTWSWSTCTGVGSCRLPRPAAAADHGPGSGRRRRGRHRRQPRPRPARIRLAGRHLRDYGLGNFLWYHDHQPETGVLRLADRGRRGRRRRLGRRPGSSLWGRPLPVAGAARADAVTAWRQLRDCAPASPPAPPAPTGRRPAYSAVGAADRPGAAASGCAPATAPAARSPWPTCATYG